MDYAEFVDWLAFYAVEPWGEVRGDLHTALICAVLAEINRDHKKRSKPFGPADFLADFWGERRAGPVAPSPDALLAKFQMFTAGMEHIAEEEPRLSDGAKHRDAIG